MCVGHAHPSHTIRVKRIRHGNSHIQISKSQRRDGTLTAEVVKQPFFTLITSVKDGDAAQELLYSFMQRSRCALCLWPNNKVVA
jgi:hypothetical protein